MHPTNTNQLEMQSFIQSNLLNTLTNVAAST